MRSVIAKARRFGLSESGAALVEFGLLLPIMLVSFAVAIEGSRTFWAYQTTISGVRDASRFIARAASPKLCQSGGNLNDLDAKAKEIVGRTVKGDDLFPSSIRVTNVTPTLSCITGNYAMSTVPVVTVTAVLEIDFPFSGVFDLISIDLGDLATSVSDSSRIYGT